MFKLQPSPTFKAPVSFGTAEGEAKITMVFKHKGKKELSAFIDGLSAEGGTDLSALMDILQGWEGVDGEFSKENLETLLDNYPAASRAIFDTYLPALLEGRVKN